MGRKRLEDPNNPNDATNDNAGLNELFNRKGVVENFSARFDKLDKETYEAILQVLRDRGVKAEVTSHIRGK